MKKPIASAAIALIMLSGIGTAYAERKQVPISNEQSDYVQRYITAVNSDNLADLKRLSHPAYLACIDDQNRDYYDELFRKSLSRTIPGDYKVVFEQPAQQALIKELDGAEQLGLPYPVKPTHQMQIDYSIGEYSFVTIVRKLVLEEGGYYEVSGCPTPQMVDRYRQLKMKRAESLKRSKALFEQLDNVLLAELTELLQRGRKIDAWKRYSQTTGESLGTAKEVLSHIRLD